ncbi:MAG: hypothetical protein SNH28_01400 [Rikenellaceae bacterium]
MKLKQRALLIAALAFAGVAHGESAQSLFSRLPNERVTSTSHIEWRQFGPGMSGYNEEFWCHPSDPKTLLMGPDMHVSHGSWDGGASWQTLKDCDGDGYDMERVIEIVFSEQNPDFAMAIDRDGWVNVSEDRGRTWNQLVDIGKCYSELAVDPTNDNNWYIGAGDFYNVKDNHRSVKEPNGIIQNRSEYGFISKSTDRGQTWTKVTKGLPDMVDVGDIKVDPTNPKVVLAITGHGLYRSENGGDSWKKSGKGLPNNLPRDMASHYDPATKKYSLYIVEQSVYSPDGKGSIQSKGGVFKSVDGGKTWSDITGNLALDLTKINNNSMKWLYNRCMSKWFCVPSKQIYKDYPKLPSNILQVFNRIRVNPKSPDEIYVSCNVKHDFTFGPADVWKTSDGGKNWIVCARPGLYWAEKRDAEYWAQRRQPMGSNMQFAHLHASIQAKECFAGTRHMEVDSEGTLYIGHEQQTLRSQNGGASWEQIDDYETKSGSGIWISRGTSDLPGRTIYTNTGVEGRVLLCTGEHGLWESVPTGDYHDKEAVGVRQIEGQIHDIAKEPGGKVNHSAHSVATAAVHPNNPDEIYILMFRQTHVGHLRKTTDGGKTWQNISQPIDYNNQNALSFQVFQHSLSIDPVNPKNMYFVANRMAITEVEGGTKHAFDGYGVYKSYDGGLTWSFDNPDLPQATGSFNRLMIDPNNHKRIYVASNRCRQTMGGLYCSNDSAKSWEKVAIPSQIKSVNNVFIDANNGYIYISCGDKGGEASEGGAWVSKDDGKSWELFFDAHYIWQVESSPVDPNIVTVVSAGKRAWGKGKAILNPGAYITRDGGKSWVKANRGLGQPDKITDLKPDSYDKDVFWCALWGSGWYKATWK